MQSFDFPWSCALLLNLFNLLKWVLLAVCTLPATVLTCLTIGIFSSDVGNSAGTFGFIVMLLALPIAMALAIGRYRLYSVDRFIDSALVHLALTTLLLSLYAAIVLGSSNLAGSGGRCVREAVRVNNGMNLAGQSTTRTAHVPRRLHERRLTPP